jgi:hypothetical protein
MGARERRCRVISMRTDVTRWICGAQHADKMSALLSQVIFNASVLSPNASTGVPMQSSIET